MEKEYRITGTPEELCHILNKEFNVDDALAKFMVSVLISESDDYDNNDVNDLIDNWYLNNDSQYTYLFGDTRYTISISDTKKDLLGSLFLMVGTGIIKQEWGILSSILDIMISAVKNSYHLEDYEWCVYSVAYAYNKKKTKYFSVKDIISEIETKDEVCKFLDNEQNCTWRRSEKCDLSMKRMVELFDNFCKKNLFNKISEDTYGIVI